MLVRFAVKQEPENEPAKSEGAGEEEGRPPAPMQRDPRDDERRDDGAGACASVEDAGGESALFFGEPFGDALDARGKNAGLAESEGEARGGEAAEGTRGGMSHGREAPERHGHRIAHARAETIDETAHEEHASGIGHLKIRD